MKPLSVAALAGLIIIGTPAFATDKNINPHPLRAGTAITLEQNAKAEIAGAGYKANNESLAGVQHNCLCEAGKGLTAEANQPIGGSYTNNNITENSISYGNQSAGLPRRQVLLAPRNDMGMHGVSTGFANVPPRHGLCRTK